MNKILKGQITNSVITFQSIETKEYLGFTPIKLDQYGLFFLKTGAVNNLTVTSLYYPFIIALPNALVVNGKDIDRVANELTYILNSGKASVNDKISALAALDGVNSLSVIKSLKLVAQGTNLNLKIRAISLLLKLNDLSMIEVAEKILLNPVGVEVYLIDNLSRALTYLKKPEAIPHLASLLNSGSSITRRSAAYAIRHTRNPLAIAPLKKALYNSDKEIRYEAVMGLAEITGQGSWGPAVNIFNSDEQRYLTYWREWAKKH
jgi:hypothetical protein